MRRKTTLSFFRPFFMPFVLFLVLSFFSGTVLAQDTLPKFTVRNVGSNRIVIGWKNQFESVKQISIQRSFDSLKNFKSILTVADPGIPENGYVDTKAPSDQMFYRLYIMLDKGVFLFSDSRRPFRDTIVVKREAVKTELPGLFVPNLNSDSATTAPVAGNKRPKSDVYVASKHVFTYKDGYVLIALPAETDKQYSIKFYTSGNDFLFEIKDIKEKNFKIDKTNFYRSGWFNFELYEDNELKEKNKFYIPREF